MYPLEGAVNIFSSTPAYISLLFLFRHSAPCSNQREAVSLIWYQKVNCYVHVYVYEDVPVILNDMLRKEYGGVKEKGENIQRISK